MRKTWKKTGIVLFSFLFLLIASVACLMLAPIPMHTAGATATHDHTDGTWPELTSDGGTIGEGLTAAPLTFTTVRRRGEAAIDDFIVCKIFFKAYFGGSRAKNHCFLLIFLLYCIERKSEIPIRFLNEKRVKVHGGVRF